MSRTGLILRQWVERDECYVLAKQAYAWDTGKVITSRTETLCVFKFENEWRAKLCATRMSQSTWEAQERAWKKYFKTHRVRLSYWGYHKETVARDGTFKLELKFLLFFGLLYFWFS
jgi:hypothetical protein